LNGYIQILPRDKNHSQPPSFRSTGYEEYGLLGRLAVLAIEKIMMTTCAILSRMALQISMHKSSFSAVGNDPTLKAPKIERPGPSLSTPRPAAERLQRQLCGEAISRKYSDDHNGECHDNLSTSDLSKLENTQRPSQQNEKCRMPQSRSP
jgi:hypothetical protein